MSEEQSTVEYRPVIGFPNYRVGNDGSVWSNKTGEWRRLRNNTVGGGYQKVNLYIDGKSTPKLVHRLVCETFHGSCPEGMQVRHFPDSNRKNNAASNVSWGTPKENNADKLIHGTQKQGESNHYAKLTEAIVRNVIKTWKEGKLTQYYIAEMYNICQANVSLIVNRKTWSHLVITVDNRDEEAAASESP